MPEVVVSEFMDLASLEEMRGMGAVLYEPELHARPQALREAVADALALVVRNKTRVGPDLLDAGPKLRLVARLGAGLDNIDLQACESRGIRVANAAGANAASVAEYVMMALLALSRKLMAAHAGVVSGAWPRLQLRGAELAGKRLGLVGYGAIAREVAARARALGMATSGYDPYLPAGDARWGETSPLDLGDLLATSDAVSVHVPLTEETEGLIGHDELAALPHGALVVNTARGGVVDERALVSHLEAGHLAGAALDVFAVEPVGPERGQELGGVPNLLLTPHVAGITSESEARVGAITVEAVAECLRDGS